MRDPALVTQYAFGTKNASFQTCTGCGIVTVATSLIDGGLYAVVNVNSFEGVEPSFIHRETVDFDGEDEKARLSRWKRNWIAHVEYVHTAEAIAPEPL